jgi:hypothetical protein
MGLAMNHVAPIPEPHRVGPVEPGLLASAVFLFSEYLSGIATEAPGDDEDEDGDIDDDAASGPQIDTRAVLDILPRRWRPTSRPRSISMRVTALYRLLATSPSLAKGTALDTDQPGGACATVRWSRRQTDICPLGRRWSADFDPRSSARRSTTMIEPALSRVASRWR